MNVNGSTLAEKRYQTIRQFVKSVDCPLSEYALRKLIDEKKLPVIQTGRKYLIDTQNFRAWFKDHQHGGRCNDEHSDSNDVNNS